MTPQCRLEPSCRLVERTLADRQVGLPQPDPLITRREPLGAIQEVPDRLGRRHPHAQDDVQPDQRDGLVGAAPARSVQSLPVGFNQPPRLLGPTLLPVKRCQESAQFEPVDPRIAQGLREEPLGRGRTARDRPASWPGPRSPGGRTENPVESEPRLRRRLRSGPAPSRRGPGGRWPHPNRAPRPAARPGSARPPRAGRPGSAPEFRPGPSDSARPSTTAIPHRSALRRQRPVPAPVPTSLVLESFSLSP